MKRTGQSARLVLDRWYNASSHTDCSEPHCLLQNLFAERDDVVSVLSVRAMQNTMMPLVTSLL